MIVSCSAPAKVILSGEHSVVFGRPALVSAIDLRLKFSLWESRKEIKDKNIAYIAQVVRDFLKKEGVRFQRKNFDFSIESRIPVNRGLGSSAALSVAGAACFLKFYTGQDFPLETINNLAFQIEKYFHQNPSGVDNSACCYGGLIYFRKEFEFLKNISRLNFKIPKKIEERLYLIDSGKPEESTGEMVNFVGREYNKKPKRIEKIFSLLEKCTKRMVVSIIKGDKNFFKRNLEENQILLEELGVVSKKTKELIRDLTQFGSGKVSGAGGRKKGSGFILFLVNDKKIEEFRVFLKKYSFNYFRLKQDLKGLVV